MEGCEGIRSAIDIKKVYDSLSLDFPLTSLELYIWFWGLLYIVDQDVL